MNRHGYVLFLITAMGGLLLLQSPRVEAVDVSQDAVLARVGEETVNSSDLEIVLANMVKPQGDMAMTQEFSPDAVLRRLIQNRLLEQEGYRIGAHERPEVKNQVLDFVQYRSMLALLDSIEAGVPDLEPAEMDSALERTHIMRRLSHILVDSQDRARALLDSLEGGTSFADLADRHSLDTTWAGLGGDLGWAGTGNFIPEFEEVLPGMIKGDVGGPIATETGWHLIYLADTHTETAGQSSSMKDAIRDAARREQVMKAMEAYLTSLKEKYGVIVNEPLLTSLDYASYDPGIQAELRTSEAVLAKLPGRDLTVKGLSFKIRFKYFHGTEGKEDADQIRDTMFEDWLAELMFRYEAKQLGFHDRPAMVMAADKLERRLLREIVLQNIVDFPFEPDPRTVKAYYNEHQDAFTRSARIKVNGVLLAAEDAAAGFRMKLEQGASINWLAERTPEVVNAKPKVFSDWLDPEVLEIPGGTITTGTIVGPVSLDGKWAVARVEQVGASKPIPLDKCRPLVIKTMRGEKRHEAVSRSLALLESQTAIEVDEAAYGMIGKRIDEWLGRQS